MHTCNLSAGQQEAGRSGVQNHPWLHREVAPAWPTQDPISKKNKNHIENTSAGWLCWLILLKVSVRTTDSTQISKKIQDVLPEGLHSSMLKLDKDMKKKGHTLHKQRYF